MSEDKFRLGFLLDADSTQKLLELVEVAQSPPIKIMTDAIDKMWTMVRDELNA